VTVPVTVYEAYLLAEAVPVEREYSGGPVDDYAIAVTGPKEYSFLFSTVPLGEGVSAETSATPGFYTEVGTYAIYFACSAYGYITSYGRYRLTITPIPQDITVTLYNLVYDENSHELIELTNAQGQLWYSVDGINYTTDVPQGTMPGEYTIYWYCAAESVNYYDEGNAEYPNIETAYIGYLPITGLIPAQRVDVYAGPITVSIPTPSDGEFNFTVSSSMYADITVDYDTKTLTITPISPGVFMVFLHQERGTLYEYHTFAFRVTVIDTTPAPPDPPEPVDPVDPQP